MVRANEENIIYGPTTFEPLPNTSLGRYIYETLKHTNGDNICMIDAHTKEKLQVKEILQKSCSLATFLTKNGFGKDSMSTVCSENNLQFLITVISNWLIGATVAPLNHNYTKNELTHCLKISKPEIVICSQKVLHIFLQFQKELGFIKKIIVIDSDKKNEGVLNLNDIFQENVEIDSFIPFDCLLPEEQMALILCSSGTTGLPKGVMISHRNLLTSITNSRDPRYQRSKPGDYSLGIMPLFHAFGLVSTLSFILKNIIVVLMKRFEDDLYLKSIQDYKISTLSVAPPLAVFLTKSPKVKKYNLSSLVTVACGGAPLSKDTEEKLKKILNAENIYTAYGLTETTLAVTLFQTNKYKPGSCGTMAPYMMGKVRDPETGKSLEAMKPGELCFKGPLVMMGYYGNHQATKEAFTSDGWLKTGDIGYYDEEGCFYIVDRLKELIKYKAFQVAPAELEAVLINHPGILDAGVVGLPDEEAGELPLAFVVKKPNITLTEKDVEEYVSRNVSSQKKLRGGVIFINSIPKNPTGKILRKELRNMLKNIKSKM